MLRSLELCSLSDELVGRATSQGVVSTTEGSRDCGGIHSVVLASYTTHCFMTWNNVGYFIQTVKKICSVCTMISYQESTVNSLSLLVLGIVTRYALKVDYPPCSCSTGEYRHNFQHRHNFKRTLLVGYLLVMIMVLTYVAVPQTMMIEWLSQKLDSF